MADVLAKAAAEGNSIGPSATSWLMVRLDQAEELAVSVGRLTHLARAGRREIGPAARDSTGLLNASARQGGARKSKRKAPVADSLASLYHGLESWPA